MEITDVPAIDLIISTATTGEMLLAVFHQSKSFAGVAHMLNKQHDIQAGYHIHGSNTTINKEKGQIVHIVTYSLLANLIFSDKPFSYSAIIMENLQTPSIWTELIFQQKSKMKRIIASVPNKRMSRQFLDHYKMKAVGLAVGSVSPKETWSKENDKIADIINNASENGKIWVVSESRNKSMRLTGILQDSLRHLKIKCLDAPTDDMLRSEDYSVLVGGYHNYKFIEEVELVIIPGFISQWSIDESTMSRRTSLKSITKEHISNMKLCLSKKGKVHYLFTKDQYSKLEDKAVSPIEQHDIQNILLQMFRFYGTNALNYLKKCFHEATSTIVKQACDNLGQLKILKSSTGELTKLGESCANLNLPPEYALMIYHSVKLKCAEYICGLVAILTFDPSLKKIVKDVSTITHLGLIDIYRNRLIRQPDLSKIDSIKKDLLGKLAKMGELVTEHDDKSILECIEYGLQLNQYQVKDGKIILKSKSKTKQLQIDLAQTNVSTLTGTGYYTSLIMFESRYNFNLLLRTKK